MQSLVWNRFATFLVWLLAALCMVYWALKFVRGPVAPASSVVAAPSSGAVGAIDTAALARGLGGGLSSAAALETESAAPSALQASRFVLTGVVVQKARTGQGVALIAVDGKPSRPYRVGTQLSDGVVLQSVSDGKAVLATSADSATGLTLELPRLTTALAGNTAPLRPAAFTPLNSTPANPLATAATAQANAMAAAGATGVMGATGQRPPRPLANRQRESEKETARDQAGSPAP
jgi:general secretion pathway protein C